MTDTDDQPPIARTAVVLRPGTERSEVSFGDETRLVGHSAPFGSRAQSLAPGHLVAVAAGPTGESLILWRWYDAVVLEQAGTQVRLWEPGHDEVVAQVRRPGEHYPPGTRAYASAGLPGADWWVEGRVDAVELADVALDAVCAFYAEHDLWSRLV